ncbi:hypothetical protein [uncultured Jannaschia sp.]|uniref:hypothetical protein n=1 Tax=uncultured Jannaschia sp. TaxID=293347 RepID=UPI00262B2993|nr:hypothetical protein [uncultured Jannaschia sp.]
MLARLALLLVCLPSLAAAGPWMRDEGSAYALLSHHGGSDGWTGFYVEYGGPFGWTYGVDVGGHVTGLPQLMQTGIADQDVDGRFRSFVRLPLPLPRGETVPAWLEPWLAALEFTVGQDIESDGTQIKRVGFGGTVGRGFSSRIGDGWTTLDLGLSFAEGDHTRRTYAGVVGVKPMDRLAVELGAFAEQADEFSYQIGPTLQYGFGRIGAARIGLAYRSEGDLQGSVGWSREF